jgi:hypothetical protein
MAGIDEAATQKTMLAASLAARVDTSTSTKKLPLRSTSRRCFRWMAMFSWHRHRTPRLARGRCTIRESFSRTPPRTSRSIGWPSPRSKRCRSLTCKTQASCGSPHSATASRSPARTRWIIRFLTTHNSCRAGSDHGQDHVRVQLAERSRQTGRASSLRWQRRLCRHDAPACQ